MKKKENIAIEVFYSNEDEGWISRIIWPDRLRNVATFGETPFESMKELVAAAELADDATS